jgi:hypothetical protein
MHPAIAHLKAFIEGKPGLQRWKVWFEENSDTLGQLLSRGQFLRLKFNPFEEIPKILADHGLGFTPSVYYRWPEWDEAGPTGAPRVAPTHEQVATVLMKFQGMLREPHVRKDTLRSAGSCQPPSSLYVRGECGSVKELTVSAVWLVDLDAIRTLPADVPLPDEPEDGAFNPEANLPPPRFFRYGRGGFCFTPDCKKVLWNWQIGPLFGHGSVYEVEQAVDGSFYLTNERMRWIS